MESLEKRELLTVVGPASFDSVQNETILQDGVLFYTVIENNTADTRTCMYVDGTQLGGSGGAASVAFPVETGDSLKNFEIRENCKYRYSKGDDDLFGKYKLEDAVDDDYNDLVVEISFVPTFAGTKEYGCGMNAAGVSGLNLANLGAASNRGLNWERSCGKQVWFAFDGTDFTPEAGESAESILRKNSNESFTLVDQRKTFLFNASGKLLTRTDNLTSPVTTYTYDGTNSRIVTVTDARPTSLWSSTRC